MWVAPASSALSSSSRTTAAGRSITSPAAIWLMSVSGSGWMRWGWGLAVMVKIVSHRQRGGSIFLY